MKSVPKFINGLKLKFIKIPFVNFLTEVYSNFGFHFVNLQVSCYRTLFPHLKILQIHLEQHSANDFLRNLDEKFCEQIWMLWLKTKSDADDADMTNTYAKFRNLGSLHLGP